MYMYIVHSTHTLYTHPTPGIDQLPTARFRHAGSAVQIRRLHVPKENIIATSEVDYECQFLSICLYADYKTTALTTRHFPSNF